jgi:hypothetical protein
MAKKTKKNRKMRGGFLGINTQSSNPDWFSTVSQNTSDMWNNISQNANDLWQKTKQAIQTTKDNYITPSNQTNSIIPIGSSGGKKSKKMRGGYEAHTCNKSIASSAAPFWQPTAKPQVWVGGKSKKNKKQIKSRKNRY